MCFGVQRILWGIFKKIVLSERLAVIVNTVYGDPAAYPGLYVWTAMVLFVLQLYTDFSGCLDIIYGVSELFGIALPENFDLPFASGSLSEFWRKWHITLAEKLYLISGAEIKAADLAGRKVEEVVWQKIR